MDKTLLKDKPEFKERIENNPSLRSKVLDLIEYDQEPLEDIGEDVLRCSYFDNVADEIMKLFTEFINENYTQK